MSFFRNLLLTVLAVIAGISCTPRTDPGAHYPGSIHILDVDQPVTVASVISGAPPLTIVKMRKAADGNLLFLTTVNAIYDSITVTNVELTKCTPDGSVIWSKKYGGRKNYAASDVIQRSDGSLVIAATRYYTNKDEAVLAMFVTADGDSTGKWVERIKDQGTQSQILREEENGNIVLFFLIRNNQSGEDLKVLRLTATGDSISVWKAPTGTFPPAMTYNDMSPIVDHEAMGVGTLYQGGAVQPYFEAWKNTPFDSVLYSAISSCEVRGIQYIGHNSNIVVGDTLLTSLQSAAQAQFVSRSGTNFRIQRSKVYPFSSRSYFSSVVTASEGGYAVCGGSITPSGDSSIVLVRLNDTLGEMWPHKSFSFGGGEFPYTVVETADHGFVIGGYTTSFGGRSAGYRQLFVLHVNADGSLAP